MGPNISSPRPPPRRRTRNRLRQLIARLLREHGSRPSLQDATLKGKWWEIFNEPELNALEEQFNIDNQNIKQYFENFMAARAQVREARAAYFPTVKANPIAEPERGTGGKGNVRTVDHYGAAAASATTRCHSKHPGRRTCGAASATRFTNCSTRPR